MFHLRSTNGPLAGAQRLVVAAVAAGVLALAGCATGGSTATDQASVPSTTTLGPILEELDPLVSVDLFSYDGDELWHLGGRVVEDDEIRDRLASILDDVSADSADVRAVDLDQRFLFLAMTSACEVPAQGPSLEIRSDSLTVRPQPIDNDADHIYECEAEIDVVHVFEVDRLHRPLLPDAITDLAPVAVARPLLTEANVDLDVLDLVTGPTFLLTPADFATLQLAIDDPAIEANLAGNRERLLLWPGEACDPAETVVRFRFYDDRTEVELLAEPQTCERPQRFLASLRVYEDRYEELRTLNPDWAEGLDEVVLVIQSSGPNNGWTSGQGGPDPDTLRMHRLMTAADVAASNLDELADARFAEFDESTEFLLIVPTADCGRIARQELAIADAEWRLLPGGGENVDCDDPRVFLQGFVVDRAHLPLFTELPVGS